GPPRTGVAVAEPLVEATGVPVVLRDDDRGRRAPALTHPLLGRGDEQAPDAVPAPRRHDLERADLRDGPVTVHGHPGPPDDDGPHRLLTPPGGEEGTAAGDGVGQLLGVRTGEHALEPWHVPGRDVADLHARSHGGSG